MKSSSVAVRFLGDMAVTTSTEDFGGETAVPGGDSISCGASARLFSRGTLAFVERSDNGFLRARSSSIGLGLFAGEVGDFTRGGSDIGFVGETLSDVRCFAGLGLLGSSSAPNDLFNGEAVAGRDADVSLAGEADPVFTSFGFGRTGIDAVAGLELDFSLPLRRLSGRANGNSRRGGISCSRVSGMAIVNGVDRRADARRGSAGSDEIRAGLIGSAVPEDQCSLR